VLGELASGQPLLTQLAAAEPRVLLAAAVLAAASFAPLAMGEQQGDEVFGPFTPTAENLNGEPAPRGRRGSAHQSCAPLSVGGRAACTGHERALHQGSGEACAVAAPGV
jgi:hypothetical protein